MIDRRTTYRDPVFLSLLDHSPTMPTDTAESGVSCIRCDTGESILVEDSTSLGQIGNNAISVGDFVKISLADGTIVGGEVMGNWVGASNGCTFAEVDSNGYVSATYSDCDGVGLGSHGGASSYTGFEVTICNTGNTVFIPDPYATSNPFSGYSATAGDYIAVRHPVSGIVTATMGSPANGTDTGWTRFHSGYAFDSCRIANEFWFRADGFYATICSSSGDVNGAIWIPDENANTADGYHYQNHPSSAWFVVEDDGGTQYCAVINGEILEPADGGIYDKGPWTIIGNWADYGAANSDGCSACNSANGLGPNGFNVTVCSSGATQFIPEYDANSPDWGTDIVQGEYIMVYDPNGEMHCALVGAQASGSTSWQNGVGVSMQLGDCDGCDAYYGIGSKTATLNLEDTYGDGWNDADFTVERNGVNIGSWSIWDTSSSSYTDTFKYNPGDSISIIWSKGNYDSECSLQLVDDSGTQQYYRSDFSSATEGETVWTGTLS